MKKIFLNAFKAIRKIKFIVIINLVVTIISLGLGLYFSVSSNPFVINIKQNLMEQLKDFKVLQEVLKVLTRGNIFLAIIYTFVFNLFSGAFLSTTLSGIIFPLPVLISFERGVLIGLLYGGISGSIYYYIIFIVTLVLEFTAYILSSSAGVNIGLSFFAPKRFNTSNRIKAFGRAWIEAAKIYPLIIFILLIAACWEIIGLHFLIK